MYGFFDNLQIHVTYFDLASKEFVVQSKIDLPVPMPVPANEDPYIYFMVDQLNKLIYIQYGICGSDHQLKHNILIQGNTYYCDPYPDHMIDEVSDQGVLWCRSKKDLRNLTLIDRRIDQSELSYEDPF